jgi:hypothetical protein
MLLVNGAMVVERDRVVGVDEDALAAECTAVHRSLLQKA